jgi:LmbE family N-acetylglucosaminyl deacetylase
LTSRVVVSAHLDDAVLSAFSVLEDAVVVTVFTAVPPEGSLAGWDRRTGATDSSLRARDRLEEDRNALAGLATPVHLGFADGQYVDAGLLPAPSPDELAAALEDAVGGAAEVYAPAALANDDHVFVRDAVLAVRPDATLYADLPYALRVGFDRDGSRQAIDVTLPEEMIDAKLEALRAYATQLPRLERDFGPFADAAGLGRERFWPF